MKQSEFIKLSFEDQSKFYESEIKPIKYCFALWHYEIKYIIEEGKDEPFINQAIEVFAWKYRAKKYEQLYKSSF